MSSLIVTLAWGALNAARAGEVSIIPPQTMTTDKPNERISLQALKNIRDPFKRLGLDQFDGHDNNAKTELESVPVSEFKMVGVLTGPYKTRALVRGPSGSVYPVSDGMRMGTQNGYVRKVLPDRIIVNEIMLDILGDKELVTSEIRLSEKSADRLATEGQGTSQPSTKKKDGSSKTDPTSSIDGSSSKAARQVQAQAQAPAASAPVPAATPAAAPTPTIYGGRNFNQPVPAPIVPPKTGLSSGFPSSSSQQTAGSR